jgi:pilus assembly protein Flp/PilA
MITRFNFLRAWLVAQAKTERGASLVEYALLVALIAVVVIGAVTLIGTSARDTFDNVGDELQGTATTTP